jgi:hypothetical protein
VAEQQTSPPAVRCVYRNETRAVHADAGSDVWAGIRETALVENISGSAPRQATWFKTSWSDRELRILFHAEDSDAWATLTAHDAPLYEEEVVEVFLDPVGDLECYFEIEVNPLNATLDVVLRRTGAGYRKNFDWHCEGLRTAVKKHAGSWDAELSIPFASMGCEVPREGRSWRANFLRIDRPKGAPRELSAWSPTRCGTFHDPRRFGFVEFAADRMAHARRY